MISDDLHDRDDESDTGSARIEEHEDATVSFDDSPVTDGEAVPDSEPVASVEQSQPAKEADNTEKETATSPDVSGAVSSSADVAVEQYRQHMEELWNLRPAYTRLARAKFELEVRYEETVSEQQRKLKKSLQTGVEIADELRRLVTTARGGETSDPVVDQSLIHRLIGRKKTPPTATESEWLGAFERLWQMAVGRMEASGVHFIELLGKDLNEVEFEGQPLKRMVSVKNKPDGDALIVRQEICGLWIYTSSQQLVVIQRGEVLC